MGKTPNSEQLTLEFQRLSELRDLAAYNCVNAIQFVLAVFEAQEFERSRQMLQEALDAHKRADEAITEFHVRLSRKPASQPKGDSHAA